MSKNNIVSLFVAKDESMGISITLASDLAVSSDDICRLTEKAFKEVMRIHAEKAGRAFDIGFECADSLIYNGYPVSYWHRLALHYRALAVKVESLTETAIDSEPSPNGMEGE